MRVWPYIALIALWALGGCSEDGPASGGGADALVQSDGGAPEDAQGLATDGRPPSEDGAPPPASFAEITQALCPAYARIYCEARCGCQAAPGFPEDCAREVEQLCEAQLMALDEGARAGQGQFVAEGVAPCIEALSRLAEACRPLPQDSFFAECALFHFADERIAPAAEGEPCTSGCAVGLRCGGQGRCVVPKALGEACEAPSDCQALLLCERGVCVAADHSDVGQSCASSEACSGDTGCLLATRTVCSLPVSGGSCFNSDHCAPHEWCDTEGPEGVCRPGGADGEPCGDGVVCQEGLACAMETQRCAPAPQAGEPCALGVYGPFTCAPGLACLAQDRLCGELPGEGERCALAGMDSPSCAEGLGCVFEVGEPTCEQRRGEGEACELDDTCAQGLFCDFRQNRCVAVAALGAPCPMGNECGSQAACVPDEQQQLRCVPIPEEGEACFLDGCAPGLVCRPPHDAGVCAPSFCLDYFF